MKYIKKNIKRIFIIPILLFFVVAFPFVTYANSLTSTNYQVDGFNFSLGGSANSTSTNYQLESSLELTVDITQEAVVVPPPPPPPPGGSGDTTPPVITNVTATNISDASATISWTTDEISDSIVFYGLTTGYEIDTIVNANDVITHIIVLTGLTANTEYHFAVRSTDTANNYSTSGDYIFTTLSSSAPIISNVQVTNITGSGARINWDTNEPTNSKVEYGLTTTYGNQATSSTFITFHPIDINGLTPATLYHFRVISVDSLGNGATSTDYTFNTTSSDITPPVISNVQAINITDSSANITWNTNENADSTVQYGLTTGYEIGTIDSLSYVTSHNILLNSLLPNTTYHYRVNSKDSSGNQAGFTEDFIFTTASISPPAISNVQALNITGDSVRIYWDTNKPANSKVEYGLTTAYGNTFYNTNLDIAHVAPLNGLLSQTNYHYRVISVDSLGNGATSTDYTFTTLDITPPTISNIQVTNITNSTADISWITNEGTTSKIFYKIFNTGSQSMQPDGVLKISHFNTLSSLIANIQYEFFIEATDGSGNKALSPIGTFTTLPDNVPPSNVSNFVATPDDTINVLTWQNPIDSDFVGVRILSRTNTYPQNPNDGRLVFNGPAIAFTDSNLSNGTKYYYTIFAYDTSGNYSSGAITDGTPFGPTPPVLPPIETPTSTLPEEPIPPITGINLGAFKFFTAKGLIELIPDNLGTIETLTRSDLKVSIDINNIPDNLQLMTLRINNSNYLMKLNSSGIAYDAEVILPSTVGIYSASVTLVFENTQQVVNFGINLKNDGLIFEKVDDTPNPLEGSIITLYELKNGNWIEWPASNYYQDNPVLTQDNGSYRYIVPNGTYYLEIYKSGYNSKKTNRFTVTKNYINDSLELFAIPKKLLDVIDPDALLLDNIGAITKNIGEQIVYNSNIITEGVVNIAQNPNVELVNNSIAAPTLTTIAIVNTFTAIPLLNLFSYLQYLLTQPLLFFKRKKRKAWGVVYDAFTKLPLDLAIIRLIDRKFNRIIRTVVTDKEGRYILFGNQGTFSLASTKPGYIFPSAFLKKTKTDSAYVDLYYGEDFDIKQDSQTISYNIPMDPIEKKESIRKLWLKNILRGLQYGLAVGSIVFTLISFIITPNIKIGIFLIFNIMLLILFIRLARPKKFKEWGIITDSTGKPIKNAVVRLFETEYNKLLSTQLTDNKGRYAFLAGRNVYYITCEKSGYEIIKTKPIDTRTKSKTGLITVNMKLEKKGQF